MDYLTASRQIDRGMKLTRTFWFDPDLAVFLNKHGDVVQQRPNEPEFPFDPTDEDIEAGDWEFVRMRPNRGE